MYLTTNGEYFGLRNSDAACLGLVLEEASSSSVKLYESSAIHGLLSDYREARFVACDDWSHIERVLINAPLNA
jgi:hypothetical protein